MEDTAPEVHIHRNIGLTARTLARGIVLSRTHGTKQLSWVSGRILSLIVSTFCFCSLFCSLWSRRRRRFTRCILRQLTEWLLLSCNTILERYDTIGREQNNGPCPLCVSLSVFIPSSSSTECDVSARTGPPEGKVPPVLPPRGPLLPAEGRRASRGLRALRSSTAHVEQTRSALSRKQPSTRHHVNDPPNRLLVLLRYIIRWYNQLSNLCLTTRGRVPL